MTKHDTANSVSISQLVTHTHTSSPHSVTTYTQDTHSLVLYHTHSQPLCHHTPQHPPPPPQPNTHTHTQTNHPPPTHTPPPTHPHTHTPALSLTAQRGLSGDLHRNQFNSIPLHLFI